MDLKIKMQSSVNSGSVNLRVEAKNARFVGNPPTRGTFKLEFYLRDNVSPTYLPVKQLAPIEVDYSAASLGTVNMQKNVTPGLSINPEDNYKLHVKLSVRAITPDGAQPYGPKQDISIGTSVRCDGDVNNVFGYRYGANSKGCVNADPEEVPVATFPAATYPKINENIRAAFASGRPGQQDAGNPIHRANEGVQTANYNASCGSVSRKAAEIGDPPPTSVEVPAWQCDEYPFASSNEGGVAARMQWVPAAENSAQGTLLRELYVNYRIMLSDAYEVSAPN